MRLPISSLSTVMPAARIQSATRSFVRRIASEAKGRTRRSGSSLTLPRASHRSVTVAAKFAILAPSVSAVGPGGDQERHVVVGRRVGDAEPNRHPVEEGRVGGTSFRLPGEILADVEG